MPFEIDVDEIDDAALERAWESLENRKCDCKDGDSCDLANGLGDAFGDGDDEDGDSIERQSFNIETKRDFYEDVPFPVIDSGDMSELRQYKRPGVSGWGGGKSAEARGIDARKVFCPTGPGGGVDPTCSKGGAFRGPPANPNGVDTQERYRYPDGTWTPERQAMHDRIVAEALAKATPVENPAAYLMGGGPASGKTSMLEYASIPKNHVLVDADEVKQQIPEYREALAVKDIKAAAFVHEESSYISKRILKEAAGGSYNVLLDGTGDSSLKSVEKKVAVLRSAGHAVHAMYVTVDTETALSRNVERAKKTGRMPPESFVRYAHAEVSRLVPQAIDRGVFDTFALYDTNGNKAVRVAEAEGSKLVIYNEPLWDQFLAKGNE